MAGGIDTRNAERRVLRFATPAEALSEARRLVEAGKAGRLRQTGNWTIGQALGHVAHWAAFAYEPCPLQPPLLLRLLLRLRKRQFLASTPRVGVRIPRVDGGTLGTDLLSPEQGLECFERILDRLQTQPPTQPHVLFGQISGDDWISMTLRHAELHLGFFHPEEAR